MKFLIFSFKNSLKLLYYYYIKKNSKNNKNNLNLKIYLNHRQH